MEVNLHWLRNVFDPTTHTEKEMLQYMPLLLLLAVYKRKFTPGEYAEAACLSCTVLTNVVQGLVMEGMINLYVKEELECPALREQFKVTAKHVRDLRHKAIALIDRMIAMPDLQDEKKLN